MYRLKERKKVPKELVERIEACERSRQHTLDISNLSLEKLPEEVLGFTSLKVLKAGKNNFSKTPGLDIFRYLEQIDLSRNALYDITVIKFSMIPELRVINLSRNQIDFIPSDISKLPFLEYLDLSYNKLVGVPMAVQELTALKEANLSNNNIRTLGEQFERIVSLETLNLINNPELDVESLPIRTRRLHEKQLLLRNKSERRALVKRALGLRKSVLQQQQEEIIESWRNETIASEFPK